MSFTPLHAVQLAATLDRGTRITPYWVEGAWEGRGMPLPVPEPEGPQQVLTPKLAKELREMLVDTTTRGTARRAFRRRGRPLLKGVNVAGKTGSLNGSNPDGRYEWFMGLAPAEAPRIAIATLAVQGPLYWMSGSQLAAEVLKAVFCPKGVCDVDAVERFDERSSRKLAAESAGAAPGR
jgi:cell division protein FtsI/penicillin-binding protein 2